MSSSQELEELHSSSVRQPDTASSSAGAAPADPAADATLLQLLAQSRAYAGQGFMVRIFRV